MKKYIVNSLIFVFAIIFVFCAVRTFALLRNSTNTNGTLDAADWSVTRNYSQTGDSLEIYPGGSTDSYTLTVTSNSEVDIDNLGYESPTAGSLTIENANTVINYNDSDKTKTHILTFRATSGAQLVTDQEINIDVEFRQDV